MPNLDLFTPVTGGTTKITLATSTAAVALTTKGDQVRVYNSDATNIAFINFGDSTVTATLTTSLPIGPGQVAGFTIGSAATHVATISAAGTPIVYISRGDGC